MPDRTFSNAIGYEKAHPIFQFIKDPVEGWRPATPDDFKVSMSGDVNLENLSVNTDELEALSKSGNAYLAQIAINTQGGQSQYKDIFDVKYQEIPALKNDFPNLSYNFYSITNANGNINSKTMAPVLESFVGQDRQFFSLPCRVFESGNLNAKNVTFTSHAIGVETNSAFAGSTFGSGSYFKLYSQHGQETNVSECTLLYSGDIQTTNGILYNDEFKTKNLILEVYSTKSYQVTYDSTR